MNNYAIVELENENKYVIIDSLEYENKKYFILTDIAKEENIISNEFKICIYNQRKNYFEKIEDQDEYNNIQSIFEQRLEKQQEIYNTLNNIKLNYLIKLKVIKIDGYNYTLKKENGEIILKNIEFYTESKPKINSYIYMSKNIINEKNIFQYGNIINFNNINENEIIKVEDEYDEYFLQRYYG